jgi:CRISPR-associated endonuclease Cas1
MAVSEFTQLPSLRVKSGVLVADGYGIRVSVERGHLVVSDGIGDDRRRGRFPRATSALRRLVLLGHSGFVTLDALRWVHDVGAAIVQIDADGVVVLASGPSGTADARLLRAQSAASRNSPGLRIVRDLVRGKLQGQAAVLDRLQDAQKTAREIRDICGDSLDRAATMDQIRALEAQAAASYWESWEGVPVHFARRDEQRVPEAWRHFGQRHSPLTNSPRKATNPANCLLNFFYGILETETRIAAQIMGLAPQLALLHADKRFRDSMVFDLMEPMRPQVDAFLLDLLQSRVFAKSDFVETREGVCRVLPPLTHFLVETAPRWAQAIAPVVEGVVQALIKDAAQAQRTRVLFTTPLTGANRSAGRDGYRRHPRKPAVQTSHMPQACRNCGVLLEGTRRTFCDECLPERYREAQREALAIGRGIMAHLRYRGQDPAHGGKAAQKRGRRVTQESQKRGAWNRTHQQEQDVRVFKREILPRLRDMPLSTIARVTGFSRGYCSFIRRGIRIPHPRHWEALWDLGYRRELRP